MPKSFRRPPQKIPLFEDLLLKKAGMQQAGAEPFAELPYTDECQWKNAAFAEFWAAHGLETAPLPLISSPKERGYRSTSKRRVWHDHRSNAFSLRFSDGSGKLRRDVVESALDVAEHHDIYHTIINKLNTPPYRFLAEAMNYVIIRGSYTEFTVILNVAMMESEIVRKLKLLAEHIRRTHPNAISCFAYQDPTRSAYYFDQQPIEGKSLRLKKLYGYDFMRLKLGETTFFVPPTSFSQVNESILPNFLRSVRQLLAPLGDERLFDLYCGYGLFAYSFAKDYKEIIGVDMEGASIRAAKTMAEKSKPHARMKFLTAGMSATTIEELLPAPNPNDVVLLDPPRSGTEEGVISALAQRKPQKVVHIFCGIEEIPPSLRQWKQQGYLPQIVQPADMFAGTTGMEVIILLQKG